MRNGMTWGEGQQGSYIEMSYGRSPNLGYNDSDHAYWINSMGGVYQYLDRSEITNFYGSKIYTALD